MSVGPRQASGHQNHIHSYDESRAYKAQFLDKGVENEIVGRGRNKVWRAKSQSCAGYASGGQSKKALNDLVAYRLVVLPGIKPDQKPDTHVIERPVCRGSTRCRQQHA